MHILWGQILLQILVGGHLLVIEKNANVKIAPEPFRIGDEVGARTNKKF